MSDDNKQVFRLSLEERHANPNRVFSFKFPKEQRAQNARKWLESVEMDFYEEQQKEVPLWEIIAAIAEELEFGKPSVLMNEKRMLHVVLKRMESLEGLVRDIADRDPIVVQGAVNSRRSNGDTDIDDDFINGMLDDFENLGDRE